MSRALGPLSGGNVKVELRYREEGRNLESEWYPYSEPRLDTVVLVQSHCSCQRPPMQCFLLVMPDALQHRQTFLPEDFSLPLLSFRLSRKFLVCGIFESNFRHKPEERRARRISAQPEEQEGGSEGGGEGGEGSERKLFRDKS